MTLAPAGTWAGQIADLISLADLVMLHSPPQFSPPQPPPTPLPTPGGRVMLNKWW